MPLRSQIRLNAKLILKNNWLKASALILIIYILQLGVSSLETGVLGAAGIVLNKPDVTMDNVNIQNYGATFARYLLRILPFSGAFSVLNFLLVTPLIVGMIDWYWRLTENKPQGIGDVFSWFGSFRLYGKSLWLMLSLFLRLLPWIVLFVFAPFCAVLYGLTIYDTKNVLQFAVSILCLGLGEAVMIGGFFLLLYFLSRYLLAPFLFVESHNAVLHNAVSHNAESHTEESHNVGLHNVGLHISQEHPRSVRECFRESARITRGIRGEIYKFLLSFVGWFALLMLAGMELDILAALPALYVLPYFLASCAVYAKYLIFTDRAKTGQPSQNTIEFKV